MGASNSTHKFETHKKVPKICILTCENRHFDYIKFHDSNVQDYCNKYGYTYIKYKQIPTNLPVYWWKIYEIDKLLNNNYYDYILWMDSDSIIVNKSYTIEQLISNCNNKDLIIGHDAGDSNTFNAGIFLIKNTNIMKNFIKDCLKTVDDPECVRGTNIYGPWSVDCYEQGTMNRLLKSKYQESSWVVGMNVICNYHLLCPYKNVFIYHNYVTSDKNRLSNFVKVINNYRNN